MFGWLHHAPNNLKPTTGLIVCSPLGHEAVSCHRTDRHCAEIAAQSGIPALRFDYDGTGNSAGEDMDPERGAAWIASILTAIAELQSHYELTQICLMGTRLGGLFALLAANASPAVKSIVTINPVADGRRYLRELRAFALSGTSSSADRAPTDPDGIQEVAGFITTQATRNWLSQLSPVAEALARAPPRALLVERTDLKPDSTIATRLLELGTDVTRLPFSDYAQMMLDPHETTGPISLLQSIVTWIGNPQPATGVTVAARTASSSAATAKLDIRPDLHIGKTIGIEEMACWLDDQKTLFGILTQPQAGDSPGEPRDVLLLLNSGAVHQIGPNRLYVRIARTCAAQGVTVVRMDIAGIGDSPARPGKDENIVYSSDAVADIAAAVDFARSALGARNIHCAGICSGGYHSLKAALAPLGLRIVFVINPLTFYWKPRQPLSVAAFQDVAEMARYRSNWLQLSSWLNVLSGKVDLQALAVTFLRRLLTKAKHMLRDLARGTGISWGEDLAGDLLDIAAQDTKIHFVFSEGDPGLQMLREQAGRTLSKLERAGAISTTIISGADHTFTPLAAQARLVSSVATGICASRNL